jgi:hypothetical protein
MTKDYLNIEDKIKLKKSEYNKKEENNENT